MLLITEVKLIIDKYNEERAKAKTAGKSEDDAESEAEFKAKKMPELFAVQRWLDNNAEISLKKAMRMRIIVINVIYAVNLS